jgi:hypothetical protein
VVWYRLGPGDATALAWSDLRLEKWRNASPALRHESQGLVRSVPPPAPSPGLEGGFRAARKYQSRSGQPGCWPLAPGAGVTRPGAEHVKIKHARVPPLGPPAWASASQPVRLPRAWAISTRGGALQGQQARVGVAYEWLLYVRRVEYVARERVAAQLLAGQGCKSSCYFRCCLLRLLACLYRRFLGKNPQPRC